MRLRIRRDYYETMPLFLNTLYPFRYALCGLLAGAVYGQTK